jgi:hypothetical protein
MRGRIVAGLGTLALLLLPAACGGSDDAGAGDEELSLELVEQNGSGQSGTAKLTAGEGTTTIVVELANPPAVPQPAHVHSGTCEDIGDVVAPLESLDEGESESTVMMSLDELQRGHLIVHAHKSEAEFDVSVACADIPAVSP